MTDFGVETIQLDLPPLAAALSRRLHDAGVPMTPERPAAFARALALVRPVSRRRLYWTARSVFVSDQAHARRSTACSSRGVRRRGRADGARPADVGRPPRPRRADDRRPRPSGPRRGARARSRAAATTRTAPRSTCRSRWPATRSGWRASASTRSTPHELAQLYRLMTRLEVATPLRRTRRHERGAPRPRHRHAAHAARRACAPAASRCGSRAAAAAIVPRRLVMLCDISGSMEPYARAYLQFLTSAAGSGPHAEAFVFATRLTRLTRALAGRHPERAIQRAAAAAPDWSSGTRIGDALKAFNDRHGRRGMARGAVVVILSDGWERGDPALVGREMERLGAARPPDRLGQPARGRERVLGPGRRHGRGAAALRRARERPQLRRARPRSPRRSAARRPRRSSRRRAAAAERAVGERDAGAGQLGRDAERARPEQRQHHAGMGDR